MTAEEELIQLRQENSQWREQVKQLSEEVKRLQEQLAKNQGLVLFEEYAQDGDTATLLSALRVVSRVKGVRFIAEGVASSK
jgi:predicted nuclease with TOPRIM domain